MGSIETPNTLEAPQRFTFAHDHLGDLTGWLRNGDKVQFRGVPYASIPGRFRQSVLSTKLPSQPSVATNPGPACPQPNQPYFKYWEAPLPVNLPVLTPTTFDEFGCLNLSITVPKGALDGSRGPVPILVFFHGGAFVNGSHSIQLSGREVFDGAGLVEHSMALGKEIMVVSINYRLGPLGFLASSQIAEFNQKHGEAIGNFGLHDQRRALEWIARFAPGFGGDAERITIQGTSAGAASCHYQAMFPDRKFQRAILASGTATTIPARDLHYHQKIFDRLVAKAIDDAPQEKILDALLECDSKQLTHTVPWVVCQPLLDEVYIRKDMLLASSFNDDGLDLMLGVTTFEEDIAALFFYDLSTGKLKSDEEMIEEVEKHLVHNYAMMKADSKIDRLGHLFDQYELQDKIARPSDYIDEFGHLLGNSLFDVTALYVSLSRQRTSPAGRVWFYMYDLANKYPGNSSYGKAHHGVNDLFVFNVARDMIPTKDRASWDAGVVQTQRSWILFVNGEDPWSPLRANVSIDQVPSFGPVFLFADHGTSRELGTLKEAIGTKQTQQYDAILQCSHLR
ncbi:hypothetical protein VTL71DRAFT_6613 [Oculimacula yallundae]|uniref:Carboxylic ester hydrolase n=1 Tax=Oculimacula yallundae TaxID=86028 RepID=A0ABR4BXJ0_9HELO